MTKISTWERVNGTVKVYLSNGKVIKSPLIFYGLTKESSSEEITSRLNEYLTKIGVIDEY